MVAMARGLFATSPVLTDCRTPRPLAFRLRGQDPLDDLGPGWFAMGLGVYLGSFLLFSVLVFASTSWSPASAFAVASPSVVVGPFCGVARFLVFLLSSLLCCRVL